MNPVANGSVEPISGFEQSTVHDLLNHATEMATRAIERGNRVLVVLVGDGVEAPKEPYPATTEGKAELLLRRVELLHDLVRSIEHTVTFRVEEPMPPSAPEPPDTPQPMRRR